MSQWIDSETPGPLPPVPGPRGDFPNSYPPAAPPSSTTAMLSMIFGIVGWVLCGLFLAIPAVICGHMGLGEIARKPQLQGRGMAIAGLILGYSQIALTVLAVVVFIIIVSASEDWESAPGNSSTLSATPPEEAEYALILPQRHNPNQPIAAAIWLHGYGADTSELDYFEEEYQQIADDLGIAVIGISATSKMDVGSYEWAEDRETDYSHLTDVLDHHSHGLTLDWPNVALFGFSQGAKVAGDLASHHPGKFRGAILMSPGGHEDENVPTIPTQGNAAQYYVCVVGADESFGNVRLTRTYAQKLRKLGAKVFLKEYEGVEDHSTPPDYFERLPEWLGKILDLKTPNP